MSSTNVEEQNEVKKTLSEGDIKFLTTCLTHITGGSVSVDIAAVATDLGLATKTIQNRFGTLKKEHGINLSAGKSGDGGPPKTPSITPRKRTTKVAEMDGDMTGSPKKKAATPRKRTPKKGLEVVVESKTMDDDELML